MLLQHLKQRHLNTNLHTVWLDEDNIVATFPLWDLQGRLVGYQSYRPNSTKEKRNDFYGKYHTKISKQCDYLPIWGLESWNLSNILYVTEGLFDAARITSLGFSAIAIFTYNPADKVKNWLKFVKQIRPVISICDSNNPGKEGHKLSNLGHKSHVVKNGDISMVSEQYVDLLLSRGINV